MPKLPDLSMQERPSVQAPTGVSSYRAATGQETMQGDALSRVGAQGMQVAHEVQREEERINTLRAEEAFTKLRQRQLDLTYGDGGVLTLKGGDALRDNLPKKYGDQLSRVATELSASLANDKQKEMFTRRAAVAGLELQETAFRHAAQQSDVYANNVLQGTLDTEARVAAAGGPVDTSLVRIDAAIDRHAQRFGIPEQEVTALKMKAADTLWSSKIKGLMFRDPLEAQRVYNEHANEIGPTNKPIIEHELKVVVDPIKAKAISDYILGGRNPAGLPNLQKTLGVQGEPAIIKVAQQLDQETDQAPSKSRDTRAMLGDWVAQAERVSNEVRPNDPTFRDLVVQQVKNHVSTIVAMQQGIQLQAQGTLLTAASGGPDGKGPKPLTLDELFRQPGAREAYIAMDPQAAAGVRSLISHNAHEAATGAPVRSIAGVVKGIFDRIHLPDNDPKKITSPAQLTEFFAKGVNREDYNWLKRELDEQQSAGGRSLTADLQRLSTSAHAMILRSPLGQIQPEKAEEAAYRFRLDLQQKVDQYRKDGKDPRTLLVPGSPDYALSPERVASFMPNARQVVREEAGKTKGQTAPGNIDLNNRRVAFNQDGSISTVRSMSFNDQGAEVLIPTVVDGKVVSNDEAIAHYRKTGEFLGKFNSPASADSYAKTLHTAQDKQYSSLPRVANDADFDNISPGARFIGPDGFVRTKPK